MSDTIGPIHIKERPSSEMQSRVDAEVRIPKLGRFCCTYYQRMLIGWNWLNTGCEAPKRSVWSRKGPSEEGWFLNTFSIDHVGSEFLTLRVIIFIYIFILFSQHEKALHALANALLEHETLNSEEIKRILVPYREGRFPERQEEQQVEEDLVLVWKSLSSLFRV